MVDTLPQESYRLTRYVARSSLLSAGTDCRTTTRKFANPTSEFQARQFNWDAGGSLTDLIDAVIDDTDILLWDLIDERHGVFRFSDGTYLTRTVDIMTTPGLSDIERLGEHIAFGTDAHFAMWTHAADRFVDWLRKRKALHRTLLVAVPWAETLNDGSPAPVSMGVPASQGNAAFARYYGHLSGLGMTLLQTKSPIGDAGHRWGPAPFHYTSEVYASIREKMLEFAIGVEPPSARSH